MKFNKRGQLLGLPLVYILALVVGALILIFGVYWVVQLQDTAESVMINEFINDLRSEVSKYSALDPGSSKLIDINLPGKVSHVCFRGSNLEAPNNARVYNENVGLINQLDPDRTRQVFLIPLDSSENTVFRIDKFGDPFKTNPFLCLENRGKLGIVSQRDFVLPFNEPN